MLSPDITTTAVRPSSKSLFSTTHEGAEIDVTVAKSRTRISRVEGQMLVVITLPAVDPNSDENEVFALDCIDELIDVINTNPAAAQIVHAENIRLTSKTYIDKGNGQLEAILGYGGNIIYEEDDYLAPAPGSRAYQLDLGIPDRSV
jgi:hypothetical protein